MTDYTEFIKAKVRFDSRMGFEVDPAAAGGGQS